MDTILEWIIISLWDIWKSLVMNSVFRVHTRIYLFSIELWINFMKTLKNIRMGNWELLFNNFTKNRYLNGELRNPFPKAVTLLPKSCVHFQTKVEISFTFGTFRRESLHPKCLHRGRISSMWDFFTYHGITLWKLKKLIEGVAIATGVVLWMGFTNLKPNL